jgi:hypothetical protein
MILIDPVSPDEVYVPQYNPGVIYGAPEPVYLGYSTGEMIGAGVLAFGAGVAVGVLASRDWGWHRWNTDWHHHDVVYQNKVYVSNSNTFPLPVVMVEGGIEETAEAISIATVETVKAVTVFPLQAGAPISRGPRLAICGFVAAGRFVGAPAR